MQFFEIFWETKMKSFIKYLIIFLSVITVTFFIGNLVTNWKFEREMYWSLFVLLFVVFIILMEMAVGWGVVFGGIARFFRWLIPATLGAVGSAATATGGGILSLAEKNWWLAGSAALVIVTALWWMFSSSGVPVPWFMLLTQSALACFITGVSGWKHWKAIWVADSILTTLFLAFLSSEYGRTLYVFSSGLAVDWVWVGMLSIFLSIVTLFGGWKLYLEALEGKHGKLSTWISWVILMAVLITIGIVWILTAQQRDAIYYFLLRVAMIGFPFAVLIIGGALVSKTWFGKKTS